MNPEEVNSVPPVESVQESVVYQEPLEEGKKKKTNIILLVVIMFLFLGLSAFGYLFWSRLNIDSESDSTENVQVEDVTPQGQPETEVEDAETFQGEYEIVLLENIKDSSDTDVYIKNVETGEEEFFRTIPDAYRSHYHPAEFYGGTLYIIRRIGYDDYPDEEWTDELWRYEPEGEGERIYTTQGLDFRVGPEESIIAINTHESLVLLSNSGDELKIFEPREIITSSEELEYERMDFRVFAWGDGDVWLSNTIVASLQGLVNIDLGDYSVKKYDLVGLDAGTEFALDVSTQKLAFTDYPVFMDEYMYKQWKDKESEVTLRVYDLDTEEQEEIATSITKEFEPEWIEDNLLEYNDPDGSGRLQVVVE
jgi:hypothetical protein